jgi:hypothetical protein
MPLPISTTNPFSVGDKSNILQDSTSGPTEVCLLRSDFMIVFRKYWASLTDTPVVSEASLMAHAMPLAYGYFSNPDAMVRRLPELPGCSFHEVLKEFVEEFVSVLSAQESDPNEAHDAERAISTSPALESNDDSQIELQTTTCPTLQEATDELFDPSNPPSAPRLAIIAKVVFRDFLGYKIVPDVALMQKLRRWRLATGPNVPILLCPSALIWVFETGQHASQKPREAAAPDAMSPFTKFIISHLPGKEDLFTDEELAPYKRRRHPIVRTKRAEAHFKTPIYDMMKKFLNAQNIKM